MANGSLSQALDNFEASVQTLAGTPGNPIVAIESALFDPQGVQIRQQVSNMSAPITQAVQAVQQAVRTFVAEVSACLTSQTLSSSALTKIQTLAGQSAAQLQSTTTLVNQTRTQASSLSASAAAAAASAQAQETEDQNLINAEIQSEPQLGELAVQEGVETQAEEDAYTAADDPVLRNLYGNLGQAMFSTEDLSQLVTQLDALTQQLQNVANALSLVSSNLADLKTASTIPAFINVELENLKSAAA